MYAAALYLKPRRFECWTVQLEPRALRPQPEKPAKILALYKAPITMNRTRTALKNSLVAISGPKDLAQQVAILVCLLPCWGVSLAVDPRIVKVTPGPRVYSVMAWGRNPRPEVLSNKVGKPNRTTTSHVCPLQVRSVGFAEDGRHSSGYCTLVFPTSTSLQALQEAHRNLADILSTPQKTLVHLARTAAPDLGASAAMCSIGKTQSLQTTFKGGNRSQALH